MGVRYASTMRNLARHRYTWGDYLAFEEAGGAKHEYLDGDIFAMAGGTPEHALIAANVAGQLGTQLRGKPCKRYTSDLRVRVAATGLATYPDVSVICGKPHLEPKSTTTVLNPTVLVEVLSPSTEEFDRGEKFDHYRRIPSLKGYVLVAYRERRVEVFRRRGQRWTRTEARSGESVPLEAIRCSLDVDGVYEGVDETVR